MALDWNKEVSFSSIIAAVQGKNKKDDNASSAYPTKTTMNLYQVQSKTTSLASLVIIIVVAVVGLGVLLKFGVLDPLGTLNQKQSELASQQELLMAVSSSGSGYSETARLYTGYLTALGSGDVTATDVLNLIEQNVKNVAKVSVISYASDIVSITVNDVNLETIGHLAQQLESQDKVVQVNVMNAKNKTAANNTAEATIVITFESSEKEE